MKGKLEHHLNPLHVYCKLIDKLGVSEPTAYRIAVKYEKMRKYWRSKWSRRIYRKI